MENAGPGCGVRGPGVWKTRGLVENRGCDGKHEVSVENTGSKCQNEVEILLFQIAMKINRCETRFLVIKGN